MKRVYFLIIAAFVFFLQVSAQELGEYKLGQDFSNTDHVGCRKFMPFKSGEDLVLVDLDNETKIIGITYTSKSKKAAKSLALKYMSECKFKNDVFAQDKWFVRYATQKTGSSYIVVVVDMRKKDQLSNSLPAHVSIPKLVAEKKESLGGLWKLEQFVDEFGDKVGEKYCTLPYVKGAFSNTATSGSNMFAKLFITKDRILFKLLEYDDVPVIGDDYFTILVKDSKGHKSTLIGKQAGEHIVISDYYDSDDFVLFKSLLKKGGKMQFVLKGEYESKYRFTMNVDGYVDIFASKPWE